MLALCVNRFEADPIRVTEILGLQPTFIAHKGSINPKNNKQYRSNGWNLDVHPEPLFGGADCDLALSSLLALIAGREAHFTRLHEELQPEVAVYGGLYVKKDDQCGVWLDAAQMRILAGFGISWGLDIFRCE